MKKHLQKWLLRITAVLLLTMGIIFSGQAQELNTTWERSARTGAAEVAPAWFTVGSVRGMAYGTVDGNTRVYAADRANSTIQVMDAATGADVTPTTAFDLTGVGGGTFSMNDVEVSDDGVIFLGNLSGGGAASPFRLYWWTTEGGTYADSATFAVSGRVGDKFTVKGSVSDNSIEIWMPEAASNPGKVYVATTSDNGASWDLETITLSGTNVSIPANSDATPLELGRTGDFYIVGNGTSPKRYDATGAYVANSQFPAASYTGSRNGLSSFMLDGKSHLSVYTYRPDGTDTGNKTGQVYVYDVSDATAPITVGETGLMGDDEDTFSSIHGEAHASVNEDGTYNIYAMDGVNGFVASTNAEPSSVFISEYIEGSGNNKAIEIFNGSDSTVDLSNFRMYRSNNGNATWQDTLNLSGSLASGAFYIIANPSSDPAILALADTTDEITFYNGDDALALVENQNENWVIVDVIGILGVDPGSAWDVAGVAAATNEQTLLRKRTVMVGNTDWNLSAGTDEASSEWIVKDQDDFSNLGMITPLPPLAGDYYIPKGTNDMGFDSLAAAIDYLNMYGVSGETTFLIDGDLTENTDLRINQDNLTEENDLYIQPAPGKQVTIRVNTFNLVDTRHVTIDGSNNGTDSRDLTIEKSGTSGGLLKLMSYNRFVTIENINLTYAEDFGAGTYAVLINRREGSTETGRAEEVTFENVNIGEEGKPFRDAYWLFGSTSNADFFHLDVTLAEGEAHVGRSFIRTQTHTNTIIDGNVIYSYGTETGDNPVINLNTPIDDFTLVNNEFIFVGASESSDRNYIGVNATNTLVDDVLIANNTFSNAGFAGTGTSNSFRAFYHDGSSSSANFQFLHNSVNFTENGQTGTHAVISRSSSASASATVQAFNNIFVNNQAGENSFVYEWSGETLFTNYNNIVVGENSNAAKYDTVTYATLAEMTDSLGFDNFSSSVDVEFVSGTDLRLTGNSIGDNALAGIPIEIVPVDIDGEDRSETTPYKGAFEGEIELMLDITIEEFSLLTPADDSSYDLGTGAETEIEFTWEEAESNAEVSYVFLLDSAGADFSTPLLTIPSDDDGFSTTLTADYAGIDSTLNELGVLAGTSIDLKWTVMAVASDSTKMAENAHLISFTRMVDVSNEPEEQPLTFKLDQNYPNPFNPSSTIQFSLPQAENVRLDVFTISGQLVATLVNNRLDSGEHSVTFNAKNLASGVYIYRIVAGSFVQTKRMTLIK